MRCNYEEGLSQPVPSSPASKQTARPPFSLRSCLSLLLLSGLLVTQCVIHRLDPSAGAGRPTLSTLEEELPEYQH